MAVDLGYDVVTQYPTVQFIGGTQTQDVVAVGIVTRGHQVYVEFNIPRNIYSAQEVKNYATGYTGSVEQFFEVPGVTGVAWSQAPNSSGNLIPTLTFTVESTSGLSAATFAVPLASATDTLVKTRAAALRKELNDSEASGG